MKIGDIIWIAMRGAIRGRMRTILTIAAISIGVASVILITSLGEGGKSAIAGELDGLGINGITVFASGTEDGAPAIYPEDVKRIENRVKSIKKAMPLNLEYAAISIKNISGGAVLWGIDDSLPQVLDVRLLYGRFPTRRDIESQSRLAVIDDALAIKVYKRANIVGKELDVMYGGSIESFRIIGIISAQKKSIDKLMGGALPEFIYIPYTKLNTMRSKETIDQIAVKCLASADKNETGGEITSLLNRDNSSKDGFDFENMAGHIAELNSLAGIVALIVSAVAAISLAVAGIGIMNTMLSSASERRREIGVCMALGARRRDIALCFLAESLIVSLTGGMFGALAGITLAEGVFWAAGMPLTLDLRFLLYAEGISLLCGLVFGVVPAVRAARLDPIVALHGS